MVTEIDISNVEISGEALLVFTKGLPDYLADFANTILHNNEISNPQANSWYSVEKNLDALIEIERKFGKSVLYEMGKAIIDCVILPDGLGNFEDAINNLQKGYEVNHRNGNICEVKILKMSTRRKKVIIQIENPYPMELNRGILTGVSRKYSPKIDVLPDVEINEGKSLFPVGVYEITW